MRGTARRGVGRRWRRALIRRTAVIVVVVPVSGSTATYAGVLPGTDLSVSTKATGVKESLVLHSAKVATSWVFPLRLAGLAPRLESSGSVSFVDGAGVVERWSRRGR
jgi:hypothetical protein